MCVCVRVSQTAYPALDTIRQSDDEYNIYRTHHFDHIKIYFDLNTQHQIQNSSFISF